MRQRAKLAQALVHEPMLLYLDEPMLGCDPVARRRIQDRIREMAEHGRTVIVSTHILPEVERLTRRIAIMHQGRLVARGDSNEVRAALGSIPSRVRMFCREPRKAAIDLLGSPLVDSARVDVASVVVEVANLREFLVALHERPRPSWGLVGHETLDTDLTTLFGHLTAGGTGA
jgi:ABC-2 type transport system ATP-binding protein